MSTLMRFIIMAVAWLVFTLATFHMCVKPTCCPEGEATEATEAAAVPPPRQEASFITPTTLGATGAALITEGDDWPAKLAELQRQYADNPEQTLEVRGRYYDTERKPDNFANMGLLRADRIKQMIVNQSNIPAERIETLAQRISTAAPAAGERFEGGSFVWEPLDAGVDVATGNERAQVVELDRDNIEIRFPYDESTENLDQQTENYLRKLAQRIQATNERVSVVGHTDIRGTDSYNMRLGQRRADFVKGRLVSYGAPAGQISTSSRGENDLAAQGDTASAHRKNRRAEVQLVRQ